MALILWLIYFVGWVANLVQIAEMLSEPTTIYFTIKIIGLPVGLLGSILGYVDMF